MLDQSGEIFDFGPGVSGGLPPLVWSNLPGDDSSVAVNQQGGANIALVDAVDPTRINIRTDRIVTDQVAGSIRVMSDDGQGPITANALYTVIDNRALALTGPTRVNQFVGGDWPGVLTLTNLPAANVTFTSSFTGQTITGTAATVPYSSFAIGDNIVSVMTTEPDPLYPARTLTASHTVDIYIPSAYYGSGTVPTTQAEVLAGTEIETLVVGQPSADFIIVNAANGFNWFASASQNVTFDAFISGAFLPVDGVDTPTQVTLTSTAGVAETYFIYNLGGVSMVGSQYRVRVRSV